MAWTTVEKPRRLDGKAAISPDGVGGCMVWKTKREAGRCALPRVVYDAACLAVRSAHHGDRLLLFRVLRLALRGLGDVRDANRPVDPPALGDGDRFRIDVSDDRRRCLDLETLGRAHRALDLAADDCLAGGDVAFDFALATDEHLATGANRAFDSPLDLDHAFRFDVADHPHSAG